MLLIEICNGLSAGQTYRLFPGCHVIGRSRTADFRLQDGCVSGKHTRITVSSDGVVLENLSDNGTSLEDNPILEPTPIEAGKRFRMQDIEVLLRPPAIEPPPIDHASEPQGFFTQMSACGTDNLDDDEATRTQAAPESTPLGFFAKILAKEEQPESSGTGLGSETQTPTRAPTGWAQNTPSLQTAHILLDPQVAAFDIGTSPEPHSNATVIAPTLATLPTLPDQPSEATSSPRSLTDNLSKSPVGFLSQEAEDATVDPFSEEHTIAQPTEVVSDTNADIEKTVKADPELIVRLREREQKKAKRRLGLAGVFLAIFGLLLYLGPPRGATPELTLSWPKKADGSFSEGGVKLPLGGGQVIFPHPPGGKAKLDIFDGGLAIETKVGKALEVPLYLKVEDQAATIFAKRHLPDLISQWQERKLETNPNYSFSSPLLNSVFIGTQNGVPATIVPYQYQNEELRTGFAWFVHLGDRLIVLRSEMASKDFDRGNVVTGKNFLNFDEATIRRFWLPQPNAGNASRQERLADATQNLGRIAPGTWSTTERALMHVIAEATAEVAFHDISRGFELLDKLRGQQDVWFRNLKLERDAAFENWDDEEVANIRRRAISIFSNPTDKRYHTIRDW